MFTKEIKPEKGAIECHQEEIAMNKKVQEDSENRTRERKFPESTKENQIIDKNHSEEKEECKDEEEINPEFLPAEKEESQSIAMKNSGKIKFTSEFKKKVFLSLLL